MRILTVAPAAPFVRGLFPPSRPPRITFPSLSGWEDPILPLPPRRHSPPTVQLALIKSPLVREADAAFTRPNPIDEAIRLLDACEVSPPPSTEMLIEPPLLWRGLPLVLVGWIEAPEFMMPGLEALGVCMEHATFDAEAGRWERCLFSQAAADRLVELSQWGSFRYPFEGLASQAGLDGLLCGALGVPLEYDLISIESYLQPASRDVLEALERGEAPPRPAAPADAMGLEELTSLVEVLS